MRPVKYRLSDTVGRFALLIAVAQAPALAAERPSFEGVWQVESTTALTSKDAMRPIDGSEIPMQPWNRALFGGNISAEEKDYFAWPPNNQRCLVAGMVRGMKGNYPWRFIETDEQITLLFEEDGRFITIPFKDKHEANPVPTWYGDAIAKWDNDTLVIDVVGFNGKTPFPRAINHTMQLRVTHRFHMEPGGERLVDEFTIDDPGAFTKPWTARTIWVKRKPSGYKLRDYRCAENNRDLPPQFDEMTFWQADWGPN